MKITLLESPKTSAHAGRGIGVYTENLKKYLPQAGIQLVPLSQNPELIHFPQWDYLSADWKLLNNNIPIVVTIHDVIPLEFPIHYPLNFKSHFNLFWQKMFLKKVKFIITDSFASVKSIHQYLGVPHGKLKFIYLGVDPSFKPISNTRILNKIKSKYRLPEEFALYIGDVNWNKNLNNLTQACLDLNLPLVIVGKNAPLIETLDFSHPELLHLKQLKNLWQNKNIHRLGYVPYSDLNLIMNLASVYCQVSFAEGFGLEIPEAMASGTPLVVSNTHSLPEIANEYGLICDPKDLADIKQKISQARILGRQYPKRPYSWEKTARETSLIYNLALSL